MANLTELIDPVVKTTLLEAEQALDTGDYLETVQKCVEVYRHIAVQHPAIVRKPQNPFAELPRARSVREGRGNALRPWPEMLGVGISFDAHDMPHFTFEKDTFSLSEAVSYFEYTLDAAIRAQRG
jgi:hypothetical protein